MHLRENQSTVIKYRDVKKKPLITQGLFRNYECSN